MGHLGWLFKLNPHPRHQHCTDEAQKAETLLSAVISICIYFSHILIIWKCRGETTIAIWPTNATGTPDHARSQDNVSCVVLLYKLSLVNKRFESCLEKLSFRSNVRLTEEMRTANAIQLHRLNI